jgi:hypothetical protein
MPVATTTSQSLSQEYLVTKEIHLAKNGGGDDVQIFYSTGEIEITDLYGIVTDTTTFNSCTGAYLAISGIAGGFPITDSATGLTLDTAPVGSILFKGGDRTIPLRLAKPGTSTPSDETTLGKNVNFYIASRDDALSGIYFSYTTSDTPVDAKIKFYTKYKKLTPDSTLTAA